MRSWLADEIYGFKSYTHIWLGYVRPRYCNGTGRMPKFISHWQGTCENPVRMRDGMFSKGEPNNLGHREYCTVSAEDDTVWDGNCDDESYPQYAVCELDIK